MPEHPHPSGCTWLKSTEHVWRSWWQDGASTTWGPADVSSVETLLLLVDEIGRGQVRLAPEARLRADGLGLTPKGKRDLRFEVVEPVEPEPEARPLSLEEYRAVADAAHDPVRSRLQRKRALLREQGLQRTPAEERYGPLCTDDDGELT